MKKRKPERAEGEVYGFVLVLRGLAWAAILLEKHPAALRVLCVAAEYMNAEGHCRIGQDTIAARLRISRQAVNRHLGKLEEMEILFSYLPKEGVTKSYALDLEGLEKCRAGQDDVDERREMKRARRRAEAKPESGPETNPAPPAPPSAPPAPPSFDVIEGGFRSGATVSHPRFGAGRITSIDGNAATVAFDGGFERRVVTSFLTPSEGATSDVARGAIQ